MKANFNLQGGWDRDDNRFKPRNISTIATWSLCNRVHAWRKDQHNKKEIIILKAEKTKYIMRKTRYLCRPSC
jgi:hypothetical protein